MTVMSLISPHWRVPVMSASVFFNNYNFTRMARACFNNYLCFGTSKSKNGNYGND